MAAVMIGPTTKTTTKTTGLPGPMVHVGFVVDSVELGLIIFTPYFYSELSFDPNSILRLSFIIDTV
jgi:hypothetical protein